MHFLTKTIAAIMLATTANAAGSSALVTYGVLDQLPTGFYEPWEEDAADRAAGHVRPLARPWFPDEMAFEPEPDGFIDASGADETDDHEAVRLAEQRIAVDAALRIALGLE